MPAGRPVLALVVLVVACAASGPATAQSRLTANTLRLDDGARPAEAGIEVASWLVGSWTGPAFEARAEEVWLPAVGDSMLGMFRLASDDGPKFYELFALTVEDGRMVLRLKHFHPDMSGWEDRDETVDFPLVSYDETTLRFGGMTIRREDPNRLTIFLAMRGRDGSYREEVIRYARVAETDVAPRRSGS